MTTLSSAEGRSGDGETHLSRLLDCVSDHGTVSGVSFGVFITDYYFPGGLNPPGVLNRIGFGEGMESLFSLILKERKHYAINASWLG